MNIFNRHVLRPYLKKVLVLLLGLLGATVGAMAPVYGKTVVGTPDTYRALLGDLQPGDTLSLEAGTYERGLPISNLHGEPGSPIVITGPETGAPAVFWGSRAQAWNTVQINNASYLTVRYLKLDGLDVPYLDAVNASGITHHITLENLEIVRHGAHQLTVGVATRGPAWDWVIRNCKIIGAGTGMYLGSWQGKNWPFVGGLIEHNLFVDTVGYNVQIKQMNSRSYENGGAIPGMPLEKRKTIIRHNVFSKANQPSPPTEGARTNLLVGHFPLTGPGSDDVYEIYGNFFYENTTEALFQGEGNIALYDNVFVNSSGSAINIQSHNDVPRNINVFHNTIVATGNGIKVRRADAGFAQRVAGNAVFAGTPVLADSEVVQWDNVTASYASADDYLLNPDGDLDEGELDLFPLTGTLLADAMDMTAFKNFSDWDLDFNGDLRTAVFRGAYAGEATNHGWGLAIDIKPLQDSLPRAPDIITQPISVRVQEGEFATFSIVASGSAPLLYQWRKDDVVISDAIGSSYNTGPTHLMDNGTVYDCVVKNAIGQEISENAVLSVLADGIAPEIVSANATSATSLTVVFSEPVEQRSAETITNYHLDFDMEVMAAVLGSNAQTVHLVVSELAEDITYTLTVDNVADQAFTPNIIASMSSRMFTYTLAEEFTDGDAADWEPLTPSRWSVVMDEGDYAYFLNTTDYSSLSGNRLGEYSLLPGSYGDFTMTLRARLGDAVGDNAQADFAIVFGYQDANNYFYMMFNNDADFTALFRVVNGVRQQVAIAGQDWVTDNLYHAVEISRSGGEITVLFDGATVLTATDSTFATGRVGVGSFNDSAYFDDISVKKGKPANNVGDAASDDTGGGGSFSPLFNLVFLLIIAGTVASQSAGRGRFYDRGQYRCGR